jgi:uncharacterized protein YjiS (DUF1127 family)
LINTTYTPSLSSHSPQTVSEAFRTLARLVLELALSLPGRALHTLVVWQQRADSRTRLAVMEDHILRDTGLTQTDIRVEIQKPFWTA